MPSGRFLRLPAAEPLIHKSSCPDTPVCKGFLGSFACIDYPWSLGYDKTERAYVEWIVRFVRFHCMQSRADLMPAEAKSEACLTDLAIQGNVAVST
jgi:hypothetical protein